MLAIPRDKERVTDPNKGFEDKKLPRDDSGSNEYD